MNDKYSKTQKCEKLSNILWKNIDWEKAEKYVKRLQIRIVKAVKKNKWNLVKRLQYLLTNSFYAKAISVKKVTTNKGKKTAGIDGEIWKSSKEKIQAIKNMNMKNYKAKPNKRIYILKKNGKKRPLSIPTMMDRAIQTNQLLALEPIEETTGDRNSYGFRRYRSCQDAMTAIFIGLSRKNSPKWILEGDIKGCFDNISHEWISDNIPMNKKILKEFLKAGYIYEKQLFPNTKGAAQGGAISPTIANMTLDKLEETIYRKINVGVKGKPLKRENKYHIRFVRYADDFIVAGESKEILEKVQIIIEEFMKERGLKLSKEKTKITNIENGFDFLGWNFRKYNNKLIIKPSISSVKGIKDKISKIIKNNKVTNQSILIRILNPIIIGWSNYHQAVCSKKYFNYLDHFVFEQLWNWALKRHRNKGKGWIVNRYWHRKQDRKWVFSEGNTVLKAFSDTPIIRHQWMNTCKNAYLDEDYFENIKRKNKVKRFQKFKESAAFNLYNITN